MWNVFWHVLGVGTPLVEFFLRYFRLCPFLTSITMSSNSSMARHTNTTLRSIFSSIHLPKDLKMKRRWGTERARVSRVVVGQKSSYVGLEMVIDASIRGREGARRVRRHGGPWRVVIFGSRVPVMRVTSALAIAKASGLNLTGLCRRRKWRGR
ncbi:hypothetical protein EDD18DRAFT_1193769 [Armillaria luteobubalina]|uniref:Uncharacterized protein n=1 Tax=Armillaria luteobubalina TaxID=153913 RepID=A0AA39PME0_9AGAR|nr:hypothetical protein EDD18DRAFT_1193769 [Armillaria luteobubalina]